MIRSNLLIKIASKYLEYKLLIVMLLVLSKTSISKSQNLIPNYSFESHINCSSSFVNSTLELCDYWFNAFPSNNTVDWNSDCLCGIINDFCPPNLYYGLSLPHTGQSMIGFDPFYIGNSHREIVGVELLQPLVKDSAYCLSFWVKNSLNHGYEYSLSHLDILFTSDSSDLVDPQLFIPSVRINNNGQLDSGSDWVQINTFYIANGNEKFMYLGEFGDDPIYYHSDPDAVNTTAERIYYYFDDFELFMCNKDSLTETILILPNVITPNDDHVNDKYEISMKNIDSLRIFILNRWGNSVREYDGLSEIWDGTDSKGDPLSDGVYFIKAIVYPKYQEQFIKHQYVHLIR